MHLGACQSKIGLSYCFSCATNLADSSLRYMFSVSQRFFCTKLHHFLIGKSCICSRHQFEDSEMKEAQHLPWVKHVTSWSLGLISTTEFHSITSIRHFPTVLLSKFTSHFFVRRVWLQNLQCWENSIARKLFKQNFTTSSEFDLFRDSVFQFSTEMRLNCPAFCSI